MIMMTIIVLAVIFLLAIIGFVTGGSKRKQSAEIIQREQAIAMREAERKGIHDAKLYERRTFMLRDRENQLRMIVSENNRHMKMYGQIYQDVSKAMLEYDRRHIRDWKEVGMVPPSFANDLRYY